MSISVKVPPSAVSGADPVGAEFLYRRNMQKHYHIVTYGCQMNVHDSERIAGMLEELGYSSCGSMEDADIVVFNTCCIRENAENHAYGNIGMLKKLKAARRDMIIAVGGCMPQQIGKADVLHKNSPT